MSFLGEQKQQQDETRWPKPFESEISEEKLPDDWKEKLAQMQDDLAKMRDEAFEIPSRYNMGKEQFEQYCDDPKNFSKEEWELMQEAKEQGQKFIETVRQILPKAKKEEKSKKRRISSGDRGWISVD